MKLDRPFYTVGEAMTMAADELAPIPSGKLTPFHSRDAWFPPGAWEGRAFSPIRFTDDAGWFQPGVVGGPFCPCGELPGELVTRSHPALEEVRHKQFRELILLKVDGMARAGEIRPTSHGVPVRDWDDWTTTESIEPLILTATELRRVFATFPLTIDAPTARSGLQLKRAALVSKHERAWPTIDRDLRDAAKNGLSAAARTDRQGMWWEDAALTWARSQGKVVEAPVLPFAAVIRRK